MKQNISFIKTADGVTAYINGKPHTADTTHINYAKIIDALKNSDWDAIPDLFNLTKAVKTYADQTPTAGINIDVDAGTVHYKGQRVHDSMVSRILDMMKEGFDITPMKNLLRNLYDNPSNRAVQELYTFLEYGKMPITSDGHFLAYKRVNEDYTSCFDGKTANDIDTTVSMPRNAVDDRSNITCSHGLHICSFEYLRHYPGARVILLKVNPADVVSIPTDYNNTKARVCRYEVIGELTREEAGLDNHSFGTSVYVTEHEPTQQEVEDAVLNTEATDSQNTSAEAVITQVLSDFDKQVATGASDWYRKGYINGYNTGKKRESYPPEVTLQDAGTDGLTQINLNDVNAGFKVGYSDGRGHKSRRYK